MQFPPQSRGGHSNQKHSTGDSDAHLSHRSPEPGPQEPTCFGHRFHSRRGLGVFLLIVVRVLSVGLELTAQVVEHV